VSSLIWRTPVFRRWNRDAVDHRVASGAAFQYAICTYLPSALIAFDCHLMPCGRAHPQYWHWAERRFTSEVSTCRIFSAASVRLIASASPKGRSASNDDLVADFSNLENRVDMRCLARDHRDATAIGIEANIGYGHSIGSRITSVTVNSPCPSVVMA